MRLGGQTFGDFSCGGDDGGLLSAAESLADWFASVINGEVFIGFLLGIVIAITIASIIKPDKFN